MERMVAGVAPGQFWSSFGIPTEHMVVDIDVIEADRLDACREFPDCRSIAADREMRKDCADLD